MLKKMIAWVDEWIVGDWTPSCASILPLLMAGAALAKGVAGAVGKYKGAKEQSKADKANFEARKKQFGQLQARRGVKLGAVQQFLGALQGALPGGAPNYQFDPGTLAELQKPVDYAEAAPADVSKGAGWQLGGDIAGAAGNTIGDAYLGGLLGGSQGAGSASMTPGGQYTPFAPKLPGSGTGVPLDLPLMTPDNPFGVRR